MRKVRSSSRSAFCFGLRSTDASFLLPVTDCTFGNHAGLLLFRISVSIFFDRSTFGMAVILPIVVSIYLLNIPRACKILTHTRIDISIVNVNSACHTYRYQISHGGLFRGSG